MRLVLLCLLLAGCSTPLPSATSSAAASSSLHVDGLVRVVSQADLTVWRVPSTAAADRLQPPLRAGALLYLTSGPRAVNGAAWWQVQPDDQRNPGGQFGWVLEQGTNGVANLLAVQPACPGSGGSIDAAAIHGLGMLSALACFGNREIGLSGLVHCSSGAVDAAVAGPSWFATPVFCNLDDTLNLYGSPLDALVQTSNPSTDRYALR